MADIYENLKERSEDVKNETRYLKNTALRIGQLFFDIIEWVKGIYNELKNFIPLSGTELNRPVTGNITVSNDKGLVSSTGKLIGFDVNGDPTVATASDLTQTKKDLTQTKDDLTQTKKDLTQTKEDLTQAKKDLTQTKNDLTQTNNNLKIHIDDNNIHFVDLELDPDIDNLNDDAYTFETSYGPTSLHAKYRNWLFQTHGGLAPHDFISQTKIDPDGIKRRKKTNNTWSDWEPIIGTSGGTDTVIEDAPADNQAYVRYNNIWVSIGYLHDYNEDYSDDYSSPDVDVDTEGLSNIQLTDSEIIFDAAGNLI